MKGKEWKYANKMHFLFYKGIQLAVIEPKPDGSFLLMRSGGKHQMPFSNFKLAKTAAEDTISLLPDNFMEEPKHLKTFLTGKY